MAAKSTTEDRRTARERLLDAANELFYAEGVHTVGIDRVIERAGVAKATLYSAYGSKDELIRAYLDGRHHSRRDRISAAIDRADTPRDRLLAVFDVLRESFAMPNYRGCAFVNASAEAKPGGPIEQAVSEYRGWLLELFTELSAAAGAPEPGMLARQLFLLYDGAAVAAQIDHNPDVALPARAAAAALLDAAVATPATPAAQ
jgi:AcrR family transcriptional regulator